ncbi:two-component sensor histidine kinase [Billgrantia sulfidoxydans]|uniref:histidine kinase n=1 Tax=Billgrantia sulfidoxydans TaxID=2733484 RepID=A0ABX7W3C7_9GAMM|nr:ATP-binding protein [Halomonas sulfidoxydans]QTP54147.1 two-component sensor histidine kinase [Halomonas sulfidoxydans]
MTSIRRRTLVLVLLVFSTSMLAIGLVSYRYAAHEIEELYDASLAQNARLLEGLAQSPLPSGEREALLESLESALLRAEQSDKRLAGHRYESKLAFQLWEGERLLLRSASAPEQPFTDRPPGYTDNRMAGHDWRIYVLDVTDSPRRVMVAERSDVRGELTRAVALRTLLPDLFGLPLLALLLWWATGRGLRPLSRLAEAIRHRDPHTLQPLALQPLPRELATIVGALNRLLERIRELRVREKRFIADAAHELRTPLAVLDLHAQNALAAESPEDRREALEELRTGVARTTRLVAQLLTLARLDPEEAEPKRHEIDLLLEVREALAELTPLAAERRQRLDLEADEATDWTLRTEPGAIATLLQNLVGNALRHSPDGSVITVALDADDDRMTLRVDDQGPGIPAAERQRVTERFHRAGPGAGAGLGLSIVERLLARHGGRLQLQEAPGGGLRALATLPRTK